MVMPPSNTRQSGALLVELVVAIGLLSIALFPIAYSFVSDQVHARALYQRAIAMEIVDGEMEALVAGEWRAYPLGTNTYIPHAASATNLPFGQMILTVQPGKARLEWLPTARKRGGNVIREASVK
jgi:hypothetical protein